MVPLLPRAPIDEVIVGIVLDQPLGPDSVDAGRYLAERANRFTRHEIHEPLMPEPAFLTIPGPTRVWLLSADDAWLVQLQQDRFHANWRRREDAPYPGFSRAGGAMHFAVSEFAQFQEFCGRQHGKVPNAVSVEVAKIDLLTQGKHWADVDDLATLMPILGPAHAAMETPGPNVAFKWTENIGDVTLAVSVSAARLKADPTVPAFRMEFRATQPATDNLDEQLEQINSILNRAFFRVIPSAERRFA